MDVDSAELLARASAARSLAYVPYSKFAMGAAVLTDGSGDESEIDNDRVSDNIVVGTLVENVSLGLAMCAERVALFSTVASGRRPRALALVSGRTDGAITMPCGACLQVALELGGPDLAVIASTPEGDTKQYRLEELIPHGPRKR